MAKLSMDADKIKSAGEELKDVAKDYNLLINELYSKINNIPKDGTWNSDSNIGAANQFVNTIVKDKPNVQALGNSMNQLGSKVIRYANSVNSVTDNNI